MCDGSRTESEQTAAADWALLSPCTSQKAAPCAKPGPGTILVHEGRFVTGQVNHGIHKQVAGVMLTWQDVQECSTGVACFPSMTVTTVSLTASQVT